MAPQDVRSAQSLVLIGITEQLLGIAVHGFDISTTEVPIKHTIHYSNKSSANSTKENQDAEVDNTGTN